MTDKDKIKEEIERQIDFAEEDTRFSEPYREGLIAAYQTIKAFIDSLPEEPASEDLEEEMIKWHKEHFGNKRDWNKTSGEYLTRKSQLDIAHHFAEWQKQQMMKNVVEGWCTIDGNLYHDIRTTESVNLKRDDEVKIIIVKED